jgi:hypothetical protein
MLSLCTKVSLYFYPAMEDNLSIRSKAGSHAGHDPMTIPRDDGG